MRLILRFLKPHWKLCILTIFLLIVDVVGALIIPTLASEMLKEGGAGVQMQVLINTAIAMAVAAVISGAGGILSGYTCAELVSRVAKDMRDALYNKSLDLAVADFRTFGVASITTRTVSDITNIQFALMSGRTSFVIAHRLSTIRGANRILFMENGNIIEQGTHRELLEKGGPYAALYNSQFA